jgi:outer membrane protein TolC
VKNILVMVLLFGFVTVADIQAEPVRLTMSDAITLAVEKNLDLQVERYNPAQQEAEYQKSRGLYNPTLQLNSSYSYDKSLGTASEATLLNAGINQLLPTGATVALGFANSYSDSYTTSNTYWQSQLELTLSQPLLKNFGREATELSIDTTRLGKESALHNLHAKLITVVANVRDEYYKLFSVQEELGVRKVSLDLARRVLSETQARVKAGVLPAMEILNAEFGVAGREKELIDAERAVQDQMEVLVQLLQLSPDSTVEIAEVPSRERYEVSVHNEIKRALTSRPELRGLKSNMELLELQTRVAGNRTRPDLLFSANIATAGLGDSYSRDMDRLSSGNYPVWGVGLTFSYPLGNRAAENDYRKNRLTLSQAALQIRNQEELIANDVRSAVRAIEANYKQLEVADRGRAFAEERLRAWARKAEVGLATTKDVLDVENDLATAKNNQIKAQVAYANAITQLWRATGQIMEKEHIHLIDTDSDALYTGNK